MQTYKKMCGNTSDDRELVNLVVTKQRLNLMKRKKNAQHQSQLQTHVRLVTSNQSRMASDKWKRTLQQTCTICKYGTAPAGTKQRNSHYYAHALLLVKGLQPSQKVSHLLL